MILLNRDSSVPLYEQIYTQIKEGITSGDYPLRSKLPSIRELMANLDCSRNTVEAAYRMLVQEGYARSQPGSGYIVEDYARFALRSRKQVHERVKTQEAHHHDHSTVRYDFAYGPLQPGTFPVHTWRMLTNKVLLEIDQEVLTQYTDPQGEVCLREEITRLVRKQRGILCDKEQVFVSNGAQPCIQSLLFLFDPTRDSVALEDPGYDPIRAIVQANHFEAKPIRVLEGRDQLVKQLYESGAKLAYMTPSSQFPMGTSMSMRLRSSVLQWAQDTDAYIIEDDYCHEFQYRQAIMPSLFSMSSNDRVIYMGTFSKSLSPSLRMNYLVLPESLATRFIENNRDHLGSVPALQQHVTALYVHDGYWNRHLRKLQTLNTRKHDQMLACLERIMGDKIEIIPSQASLHLLVDVKDGRSQAELQKLALQEGVRVYETNRYWMEKHHPYASCILLGFSAIKPEDIEPGIQALNRAWFG